MHFASHPDRTRRRVEAIDGYLRGAVSDGGAFVCQHHAECSGSAAKRGRLFFEGQLHHIGHHYDFEIDSRPTRIVVIGQEYGTAERNVSLAERREMILGSARIGFRRRNPHMRGTTSILRLMFGMEPGHDPDEECLPGPDCHMFDAFALVDFLICTAAERTVHVDAGFRGAAPGRSTRTMRQNCGAHFRAVMGLLEPTIIVVQGLGARRWIAAPLGIAPDGPTAERIMLDGRPVVLLTFVHPSARSERVWGRSLDGGYLTSTVVPAIRSALVRG